MPALMACVLHWILSGRWGVYIGIVEVLHCLLDVVNLVSLDPQVGVIKLFEDEFVAARQQKLCKQGCGSIRDTA